MIISSIIILISSVYYYLKTKHKESITLIVFSSLILIMDLFQLIIYPLWLAKEGPSNKTIGESMIIKGTLDIIFYTGFAIGFVLLVNKVVILSKKNSNSDNL